jgi:hypothetical protein
MKCRSALIALLVSYAWSASPFAEETDAEAEAHKAALDVAGAFSNDGFRLRDGTWKGPIKSASRS